MKNPAVWMQRARQLLSLKRRSTAAQWLRRIRHTFPRSAEAADAAEMLAGMNRR